ncbi:1632_t:CDS:2 [Ambispora leptoticha]|uniref:1632_t:CDS:1 n=1 Tax=Ambispora leptoticha TaxID=144679 RepID=A0A9N8ZQH6_9GLOM|nr:1632_t:CDS:2 [Ambispora leptoticha]
MSNINPTAFFGGGMGVPNQLVAMHAAGQRVLNPMQLAAMAQAQPNLSPAYNLGFPTMLAANTANLGARVAPMHLNMPGLAQRQQPLTNRPPLNQGKGILRIMLFADYLGGEANDPSKKIDKKDIMYWTRFVTEFFTEDGTMRYTLWNSKTDEQRSFDIANSVIPRYYQVNFDSGVTGIQLILGHAREHVSSGFNGTTLGHTVDCPRATMIYSYENGTRIVATGHLKVKMTYGLKIEYMDFTTKKHEEYIPREVKDTLPPSPVNDYGIPVKTLRSLEIAEGVAQLDDLINITLKTNQGPKHSLRRFMQTSVPLHFAQNMTNMTNMMTIPPTPGPSPPNGPVMKTSPKREPESSIAVDMPITTPKISAKPSPSPRISDKRPGEPGLGNKPKRRNTKSAPKKASRQDPTSS